MLEAGEEKKAYTGPGGGKMKGHYYRYGMRLRGFSLSCQPMVGLVCVEDPQTGSKYHDILVYNRKLHQEELDKYELDFLEEDKEEKND